MSAFVDKLASGPPRVVAARLGLVLFVLSAFPLLLVEVPPYQDLPNHLASIHVVEHADKYPEFVFNGHFKTNGALFAWLHLVGKLTGSFVAAKLFAALTLATAAFVLPWAVCVLTGDARRSVMASLFAWPLVHNRFVSMGMLDYALGVPLPLALLALAKHQLEGPTVRRGLGMAVLGAATWYAHGFALLIAYMLVTIELLRHGKAGVVKGLRALVLPLSPAALLVVASVLLHLFEPKGTMNGHVDIYKVLPVWELLYNAWAEWLWAFTRLVLL